MLAGDSCTVSGLSAPSNGALDSACADGATLADGASCTLTCNSGYTLSGTQPSCSAGTFSAGSVACSGEPEPQGMHDCMCIVTCLGIGSKPMHCRRWQHCGHDRLRLDARHSWRHDWIVHMHMCSRVQRCRLCYRCLRHRLWSWVLENACTMHSKACI